MSAAPSRRNLGCAVIAAAIVDYYSPYYSSETYEMWQTARNFLFPVTTDELDLWDHFVALSGLPEAWFRNNIERLRDKWDSKRLSHIKHWRYKDQTERDRFSAQRCHGLSNLVETQKSLFAALEDGSERL